MKKAFFITALAIGLSATPVLAVSPKANGHAQVHTEVQAALVTPTPTLSDVVTPTVTPTVTVSVTPTPNEKEDTDQNEHAAHTKDVTPTPSTDCNASADYKNHGAYVSCVAHLHQGGQVVSAAARSDIGKKHAEVTPTVTPTEPVSSPVTSAEEAMHTFNPLSALGNLFGRFFGFFKHLI